MAPTSCEQPSRIYDRIEPTDVVTLAAAEEGIFALLLPGEVYDAAGHVRFGLGRVGAADAFARLGTYVSTL